MLINNLGGGEIMNQEKNEEEKLALNPNIIEDLTEERYAEADGIVEALKNFPGSSREELWQLAPSCESCFNRSMAWLESEGLINFDGEYYYLSEEN